MYSNGTTASSTRGSDWREHPTSRYTSRFVDFDRRHYSGGASSSRGTLSSRQKRRRIGKGPHTCTTSTGDKDDKSDTDETKLKAPSHVAFSLIDEASGGRLTNCRSVNPPPTTVRARCLQPSRTQARRRSHPLQKSVTQPMSPPRSVLIPTLTFTNASPCQLRTSPT